MEGTPGGRSKGGTTRRPTDPRTSKTRKGITKMQTQQVQQSQPQDQDQPQSRKGYQGIDCPCKACQSLTPEQREAKAARILEARRRGGRTRAAQESMQEARSTAFWATMESHPFYARKWLRKKIQGQNELRARKAALRSLVAGQPDGRRQLRKPRGS